MNNFKTLDTQALWHNGLIEFTFYLYTLTLPFTDYIIVRIIYVVFLFLPSPKNISHIFYWLIRLNNFNKIFPRIRIWFLNRCWLVPFYFDLVPELHYHLQQYLQQLNFYQINHSLHLQTCQDECLFWSICFRFFFLNVWTEPRMINYFPTLLDISQFSKMMKK